MYYSSGFDSTVRGENMVTDLLKIRNEQYPDVSLYARTDIGASARTSTGTENAASDNENTAVTEESTLAGKSTYESSEVIVNRNYMKNELQRLFGLPFEKINVVPNGVNLNKFTGMDRDYSFRRKYAMDNEKIILYVGRLVYEKGIQHLISAMPKILEGYHDAKLVICGKGGMQDELQEQVNAMGIGNKVYFAGYMKGKDVQKMYKAADISVFPSTYEPFGIVALEAMLSENPVVVSDIGGLNEIVQHRENVMKTYCGNPNSIADSILELLYDHKLCAEITKKAKNKVRNEYNWSKISPSSPLGTSHDRTHGG